jgi:methylthioribulose-1-phosphate dehydratase
MATKQSDEQTTRSLISEFLRLFYTNGWVTGTGGGICATFDDTHVLVAPTGVHKERVLPQDLFVVNGKSGEVVRPPQNPSLRLSECASIFCQIINQRGAGAVMHSHSLSSVLASDMAGGEDHFLIESLEMLKGIADENNQSRHAIPIINNTLHERELLQEVGLQLAEPRFSRAYCILVRDHGAYIWGRDIWEVKRHAEVYHFLFDAVLTRHQRGTKKWNP